MADEETTLIEETPEVTLEEEVPQPVEPSQPTEEETTPEPEGEEPEAPAEEEPKPPSRREQLRIQQLLARMKEQPSAPEVKADGLDYKTALDADPEVIAQLESDRQNVVQTAYQQGLEQAKSIQFHTRLEIDAPRVESKYPQLNRESDQFDPAVADALNSHYLHLVGYDSKTDTVKNPSLRYADFIEAQFELASALASQKVQQTSKNIAKQAATTGLRPDGSATKGLNLSKNPEDMTDDELKAAIRLK